MPLPDVAQALDLSITRVRTMVREHKLPAVRRDGVVKVPDVFLRNGAPIKQLHGTALLLLDGGFNEDGVMEWLLSEDESLGCTPIEALRTGRHAEVRRVAATLAW